MQSWQTCALSGELIETPVISKVSGHIYEKRLIEKHIESTGTCPITGRPLNFEDLIEVKVSRVQKPRPVTATSIPSLLSLLQNEWDALLLEQFQLKQHLESVRHELTHALYQHDAACRVIAKLIKERDQARIELAQLQHKLNHKIEVEANAPEKLSQSIIQEIEQIALKLTSERKVLRKQQSYFDQFPGPEILSNYEITNQHTQNQGGVCLDIYGTFIIIGGQAGQVTLYQNDKLLYQSEQHSQKVTSVKFYKIDEFVRFTSTSDDGIIYTYSYNPENGETQIVRKIIAEQPITGMTIHPLGYLAIIITQNGLLVYYDLRNGQQLSRVTDFEGQCQFTSISLHPDGQLLAIGQADSLIKIWKITQGQLVAQFEGQNGSVTNLVFSENGTSLASTSSSEVNLWDLRKPGQFQKLLSEQKIGGIAYDKSGMVLAVGGNKSIHFFDVKKQQEFCKIESHRDLVTAIGFGDLSKNIYSCSIDKLVNIYN